jgi:predicted nucleic acid-binding protein
MLYFDTSFLTPLFLEEATSAEVEAFLARQPVGDLAISHWTRVEFSSLLAREVRMGGLDIDTARRTDAEFEAVMAESFVVLTPAIDDFALAKAYLGHPGAGLRAGDALHLAIASRPDVGVIHTFDKTLIRAAGLLGVNVGAAA